MQKKKKNHPSLQESLNAAKQFYFVLICLDLTKTFYQKKNCCHKSMYPESITI